MWNNFIQVNDDDDNENGIPDCRETEPMEVTDDDLVGVDVYADPGGRDSMDMWIKGNFGDVAAWADQNHATLLIDHTVDYDACWWYPWPDGIDETIYLEGIDNSYGGSDGPVVSLNYWGDETESMQGWKPDVARLAVVRVDVEMEGVADDDISSLTEEITPGGFIMLNEFRQLTVRQVNPSTYADDSGLVPDWAVMHLSIPNGSGKIQVWNEAKTDQVNLSQPIAPGTYYVKGVQASSSCRDITLRLTHDHTGFKDDIRLTVISVQVTAVGFIGDHKIKKWTDGSYIDNPDGSAPVWASGVSDPVCYTMDSIPTMFARFTVSPSFPTPGRTGISVRAKVDDTVIGSASGCKLLGTTIEDGANTDGYVGGISGGSAIPGSNKAGTLTPTIAWEFSLDGVGWAGAGNSGPHTLYWTYATPQDSPLYDRGLEHACGHVNSSSFTDQQKRQADYIADAIRLGIHGEVPYDPNDGTIEDHTLRIYSDMPPKGHVCADFANLTACLARTVGLSGATTVYWGGVNSTNHIGWVCDNSGLTIENVGNRAFSYHAIAYVNGAVQDAALNTESISGNAIHNGQTYYWLDISTSSLPNGSVGTPYSVALQRAGVVCQLRSADMGSRINNGFFNAWGWFYGDVAGGNVPVEWWVFVNWLPNGLNLNGTTGEISGTPTNQGTRNFTIRTREEHPPQCSELKPLSITIQ